MASNLTPEQQQINVEWDKKPLREVHRENIKIIKQLLAPVLTAYSQMPGERGRKKQELTQALKNYTKEVELKKDITGMDAEDIVVAMLTEYYEIFDETTAEQGKKEIRAFLFRNLIPIIKPFLK